MRDLVPPGLRAAFVASLACRAHERDPDIVDGEGVLAQRSFRLRRPDEPAARLGTRPSRLDRLRAVLGEEPQREGAGALRAIDEPPLGEQSEHPSCPARLCVRCVERVQLLRAQQTMLVDARRGLPSRPMGADGRPRRAGSSLPRDRELGRRCSPRLIGVIARSSLRRALVAFEVLADSFVEGVERADGLRRRCSPRSSVDRRLNLSEGVWVKRLGKSRPRPIRYRKGTAW